MDHWGPIFEALIDNGLVMCLHIGQGFAALQLAPDGPVDNLMIMACQISMLGAQDLLWGPAFRTYPELKVAFSEGGIGWIPFYLDRCDRHFTNQVWLHKDTDFGGKLPSEVFREHALACYVTDPTSLGLRNEIGIDIIAWECDYPHSDSIWPDAPEKMLGELDAVGATDEEIEKITWQNACRFFDWDPFAGGRPARSTRSARCGPVRPTSTSRPRLARSTPSATRSPTRAADSTRVENGLPVVLAGRSSRRCGQLGDELPRPPARLEQLLATITDRQDADGEVGDAGVGERCQPGDDLALVAGGQDVRDAGRISLVEQPLVVGRHSRLAQHVVGVCRSLSTSSGRHRQIGTPATTRGAGRPASVAAAVIFGTTWVSIAFSSASQRIVPSARAPASRSMTGPSAARSTCMRGALVTCIGLRMRKLSLSTSTGPGPPSPRRGRRGSRR